MVCSQRTIKRRVGSWTGQVKMLSKDGVLAGSHRELWGVNGPESPPSTFVVSSAGFYLLCQSLVGRGVGSITFQGHSLAKDNS